jgi:drug/metabolite transporter (DMT)-like permease
MILVFRARVIPLQILGMIVTLIGVILVSVKADWEILKTLAINIGDVWMLIACVFYSVYTLGLRYRPAVPGLVFFASMAVVAFASSLPLVGLEMVQGTAQFPTPKGWLILLYVALLPSLLSQIFFIRGVELIGPARAGLFVNLVPVFGALLAVVLLGEPFALYHALGLALVLGGIWLSEQRR